MPKCQYDPQVGPTENPAQETNPIAKTAANLPRALVQSFSLINGGRVVFVIM
jgi:hypothetical protein